MYLRCLFKSTEGKTKANTMLNLLSLVYINRDNEKPESAWSDELDIIV